MDRFLMRVSVGYPDREEERKVPHVPTGTVSRSTRSVPRLAANKWASCRRWCEMSELIRPSMNTCSTWSMPRASIPIYKWASALELD